MRGLVAAMAAGVLLSASLARADVVTVIDFGMEEADTNLNSFFFGPFEAGDPFGSVFNSELASDIDGGNPDTRGVITHTYEPEGTITPTIEPVSIQSIHIYLPVEWTPSVDGIINSITFSLDVLADSPVDVGFAVEDDNGGALTTIDFLAPSIDYQTVTATLGPDVFSSRDFAGGLALRFGFSLSTNGVDDGSEQIIVTSVDNFRVTLDTSPIPEPTAAALALPAMLMLRRRR